MFRTILQAAHALNRGDTPSSEWNVSLSFERNASVVVTAASTAVTAATATAVTATVGDFPLGHGIGRLNNSSDWGPKRDPLYIVVPITVLYAFIFFAGVIGNIGTCVVIARNKCMHTATNYYLFSLAVSDLLLLISGLPPEIYSIWSKYPYVFGEAFCVLQGFAAETSANATVLTITAFTVERYVAICHPFLSHTLSKLSRAIKFIVGIWIVAMSLAVPQAVSFGIIYEITPDGRITNEEHYMCNVKRVIIPHAFEISSLLFFVAPMSMITILYVLIGLQLHKSTTVGPSRSSSVKLKVKLCRQSVAFANNSTQAILIINAADNNEMERREEEGRKNFSRNAQATKHVVKMLVAVVVAFFICWAPFHAQRLLAIYGQPTTANMITAFRILTYISGILYFLSTTINPLLYHIMSHRFREAFKDTFKRFFRRGKRVPGRCYTTLSGRSSQLNSHSNTDSCSRQSSLRYLDTEVARLQNNRRPLVVSFRRKTATNFEQSGRTKQVLFDLDLQEALDTLTRQPSPGYLTNSYFDYGNDRGMFVAFNNLEPKHICPMSGGGGGGGGEEGDIVVLKERIHKRRRGRGNEALTKSKTMPPIMLNPEDGRGDSNVSDVVAVWCSDKKHEKSNSCSGLELIAEGGGAGGAGAGGDGNNTTCCRNSPGMIIRVP